MEEPPQQTRWGTPGTAVVVSACGECSVSAAEAAEEGQDPIEDGLEHSTDTGQDAHDAVEDGTTG